MWIEAIVKEEILNIVRLEVEEYFGQEDTDFQDELILEVAPKNEEAVMSVVTWKVIQKGAKYE